MKPDEDLKCGFRNVKEGNEGDEKVASYAEFPWVVAIFVSNDADKMFIGGGSILTPNVVLTAAHIVCFHAIEDLSVRAGEWDIRTENEPYSHEEREVVERICHEDFKCKSNINCNNFNDIAVLNLRSEIHLNHHIMPICLPRKYEYENVERCFVAGWGKAKSTDAATSYILRKVDLPIVARRKCQRKLQRTPLSKYFELHDSFLCAGGEEDKDTCEGDGGSPLFVRLSIILDNIINWALSPGALIVTLKMFLGFMRIFPISMTGSTMFSKLSTHNPTTICPRITRSMPIESEICQVRVHFKIINIKSNNFVSNFAIKISKLYF